MEDEAQSLATVIGARIKHARNFRAWTLDQLAEAAGGSRRMLVNVEQGKVNPSVGTLLRLSDALGVGLPALVEPPTPHSAKVTRKGTGAMLWTGEFGSQGVLVAGTEPPDVLELWDWVLNPGEKHEAEAHSKGTRELLHVLSGSLQMMVGEEDFELSEGDALSFCGDVDHAYFNRGDSPTRFSLTVYEPGVGTKTEISHE